MTGHKRDSADGGEKSLVQQALHKFGVCKIGIVRHVERPTYGDLFVVLRARENARRNVVVLREWLEFRERGERDEICDALVGSSSARWVKAHSAFMRRYGKRGSLIWKDRRSALKAIRNYAMRMTASADRPVEHHRWEALRAFLYVNRATLFQGLYKYEVPWNFDEWLRGDSYVFLEKSRPKLAKIERHLGIAEGTFLSHTRSPIPKRAFDLSGKARACPYRLKHEHELPPRLHAIVEEYFQYKIDPAPLLRRRMAWTPNFRGEYPTKLAFERTLKSFWNFAIRPKTHPRDRKYGLGLDPNNLQFIDLFRAEFVIAYLRWHFGRTQKVTPGAVISYYAPVASLLNGNTGWLSQQPDRFVKELQRSPMRTARDPDFSGNGWAEAFQEWVAEQLTRLVTFRRGLGIDSAAAQTERIRDSFEKIDEILRLPQPLVALVQLVRDHESHQKEVIFLNETSRLNYEIRTFLLVCLVCVPFRSLTWTALKVGGNVFKREGRWVIRAERELFKNRRHMARKHFEVTLSQWATPYFDHYLKRVRPRTIGGRAGSPYLIPINSKRAPDPRAPTSTSAIRHAVQEATRQHWNAHILPHAWRHICATAILKDDAEQIMLAATVLNDAPKTVIKACSHLIPDDTFKAYASMADAIAHGSSGPIELAKSIDFQNSARPVRKRKSSRL
ncbi:MAG: hypothetical protein KDJ40_15470 [Hyphomicrobiales bacterium]|nr:hypothetical protein [Hyphomicrobiales bacterium]